MSFTFKTPTQMSSVASVKAIRKAAVKSAFLHVAQRMLDGAYTRDNAVRALQPIMDTLDTGLKGKGHSILVRRLVNENLDSALEALTPDNTD